MEYKSVRDNTYSLYQITAVLDYYNCSAVSVFCVSGRRLFEVIKTAQI